MTKIEILPVETESGGVSFLALTGNKRVQGRTAGEALDALTAQLSEEETSTLVVVQTRRPDRFFNAAQQRRLGELMDEWRECRDQGQTLSSERMEELEKLVEAELLASGLRAATLADEALSPSSGIRR
jgi:hypothetical protein